jgi:hypothetical protein
MSRGVLVTARQGVVADMTYATEHYSRTGGVTSRVEARVERVAA